MKKNFIFCVILMFFVCHANISFPPGWNFDFSVPTPEQSSCVSCKISAGKNLIEVPTIQANGNVGIAVDLTTISIVNNLLLKMQFSGKDPFSPAKVYNLQEKKINNMKNILLKFGGAQIPFLTSIDEIDDTPIISEQYPEYSIARRGNDLIVFAIGNIYSFALNKNSNWLLTSIEYQDCADRKIVCTYDDQEQMTSIVLPDGSTYDMTYSENLLISVKDPAGAFTTIRWDNQRIIELKTVILPEHLFYSKENEALNTIRNIQVLYDKSNRIGKITNSNGEIITAEYSDTKRANSRIVLTVLKNYDGTAKFIRTTYSDNNRIQTVETGIVKLSLDRLADVFFTEDITLKERSGKTGYRMTSRVVNGQPTNFTYDEKGNIISETDALGRVKKFEYDKHKQKIADIYPDGSKESYKYNSNGFREEITREDGIVKTNIWQGRRLISSLDGDLTTSYKYDSRGKLAQIILPYGGAYSLEWDKIFRLISITGPDGVKMLFRYAGNLDKMIEKKILSSAGDESYTRTFSYNPQGRLTAINYPDGTSESFEYSCCDLINSTDRAGAVTRYVYDASHRKVMHISPNGEKTSFTYNFKGLETQVTYPNKTTEQYEYDEYDRLSKVIDTYGISTLYKYDIVNRLVRKEKSDGSFSVYTYNTRNRIESISGTGENNMKYIRNAHGFLLEEQNFGLPRAKTPRITRYAYDQFGRKNKIVNSNGEEQKTFYAKNGRVEYNINKDIVLYYSYDSADRITDISKIPLFIWEKAKSQAEKNQLYNQYKQEIRTYDGFGNLFEIKDKDNRIISKYKYTPDGTIETVLYPISDNQAKLHTYKHYYNTKGEQVFEIYYKLITMQEVK